MTSPAGRRDDPGGGRERRRGDGERGFVMAALLVGMAVTAVWMSAMLPTWRQQAQRQREADLIFRGEQYARAIALFAIKNNGALPTSIDDLVSQRYLRKKWKDPVTGKDFMLLGSGAVSSPGASPGRDGTQPGGTPSPAQASGGVTAVGIRGVYSESTATSIKVYNGFQQYNQWIFDYQRALLLMGRLGQPQGGRDSRGGPGRGRGPGRGDTDVQGGRRGGDQPIQIGPGRRGGAAPPAGRGGAPGRGGGAGS
jgi:type II secretory pathway pseudopilin PulG